MSPRNQVLPLDYMCIKILSHRLIQALADLADDDEGANYKIIQDYLQDTTYEVLQDLLKYILNSVNLDAAIRFVCLQLLLRSNVRKLDTGIFPHSYYENILDVIRENGTGLQQLNLKGVWVRDNPMLLSKLVRNLRKLKSLIIPHMADDEVLDAVVECKNLNILDISGECAYTPDGLRKLGNDYLKVLDIGCFGKKSVCQQDDSGVELVAEIVGNLAGLTHLRTYSYTGGALAVLSNNKPYYTTRLRYLHDTGTDLTVAEAIVKLAPELECMNLDTPAIGVLDRLSQLKKLNSLKISRMNGDELLNFLRKSGGRMQILKLNHNKNYGLDLSEVCQHTPNLMALECFQMKLTYIHPDTYFMSLQNVEILYCDITDTTVKLILSNSPFLKRIVVGCALTMTDGDIFRLCADCDFINLEELWFSSAKGLTATTIELLMGHCPNLRVIGQLSGWDVRQEEADYLRAVITFTNTDLTLLPIEGFS